MAVHSSANLRALAVRRWGYRPGPRPCTPSPPEFCSLHNPGYDNLLPCARARDGDKPSWASVAVRRPEEYGFLARASRGGVALVEANLADAWVEVTLAPFDDVVVLRAILTHSPPLPSGVGEATGTDALSYRTSDEETPCGGVRCAVAGTTHGIRKAPPRRRPGPRRHRRRRIHVRLRSAAGRSLRREGRPGGHRARQEGPGASRGWRRRCGAARGG